MEDTSSRKDLKLIEEVLSSLDFRRLKKLTEFDGDFKVVLKLVKACKKYLMRQITTLRFEAAMSGICS